MKERGIRMPGKHKDSTISFRPNEWERRLIDARVKLSGLSKKDFYARACIYSNIVVVGKKENIQKILYELQSMREELRENARQILSGEPVLRKKEDQEYLALVVAVVGLLEGASYMFEEKGDGQDGTDPHDIPQAET